MVHQRVTVLINSAGNNYPIFNLFQTKRNPSIYLHLFKHNQLKCSAVGKITYEGTSLAGLRGRIEYSNAEVIFKPIDHSSIHEDGSAHVKCFDKTYLSKTTGLPLKNLKNARQLWTIIPGSFKDGDIVTTLPKDHAILRIPDNVRSVAIDIFAVQKGDLHLNFSFPAEDFEKSELDTGKFPISYPYPLEFNHYTIYLLAYSNKKFVSPPPSTYAFSGVYNLAPFVKEVNEKYIELELRELISHSGENIKSNI